MNAPGDDVRRLEVENTGRVDAVRAEAAAEMTRAGADVVRWNAIGALVVYVLLVLLAGFLAWLPGLDEKWRVGMVAFIIGALLRGPGGGASAPSGRNGSAGSAVLDGMRRSVLTAPSIASFGG